MIAHVGHPTWLEVLQSNPSTDKEKESRIRGHLLQLHTGLFYLGENDVHIANLLKKYDADMKRIREDGIAPEDIEAPDFYWLCGAYQEATGECHPYGSCPYPAKEIYARFLAQQVSSADKNKGPT